MQRATVPAFTIAGKPAAFGDVWVHLKHEPRGATEPYKIVVPNGDLAAVFDPYSKREATVGWPDYITSHIREFGTFILEGYVNNLMKITSEKAVKPRCVLATVDRIAEVNGSVQIAGLIEGWCPELYA